MRGSERKRDGQQYGEEEGEAVMLEVAEAEPVCEEVVVLLTVLEGESVELCEETCRRTLRIRWFPFSPMYKFPRESIAMEAGREILAEDAGTESPLYPATPVPATVEITPAGDIMRTRLPNKSEKYTAPIMSTATPHGYIRLASTAGPPSPLYPLSPLPATVVKYETPFTVDSLRIRLLHMSAIYILLVAA